MAQAQGFAQTVRSAAQSVKQSDGNQVESTPVNEVTENQKGAATGALTATDSLHQKAAKGADKLAKVGKAAKRLQIQESALDGRKDARDAELAYAVGYLDESAAARSEVTLQLQKGKATIRQSTDAELIAFVEAGIDETDMDECMGNLMSYSARNGESTQPLNLLEGIF